MKNLVKKCTALLLALTLSLGMSGCSLFEKAASSAAEPTPSPSPTPEPEPEEVVLIQPGELTKEYTRGIAAVNKALKSQGIKLRVEKYPSAAYLNKVALLVNSGVVFDLFSLTKAQGSLTEIADMGLAAEISPDTELKSLFSKEFWSGASVQGKVMAVPVYTKELNGFDSMIGYRSDILKKAELEEFPTENFTEAFSQMQNAVTAEDADPAHFTWLNKPDALPLWLHRTYDSYPFSADTFMNLVMVTEEGKVKSFYESEEFKQDAKQYRSFYNEGLISDQILEGGNKVIASGKILPSQGFTASNALNQKLVFAKLGEGKDYVTSLGDTFTCVSTTSRNEALALKFLSWLYSSQENYDLFHYGTEGKDFTLDEKGRMVRAKDSYSMNTNLTGYLPLMRYGEKVSDAYIEAVSAKSEALQVAESALFTFDDSAMQEECRLLEKAVRTYIYPIKLGVKSYDDNIDEAIEELNRAGLKKHVAAYKKQYAAFLKPETEEKPAATKAPSATKAPAASGAGAE